MEESQELLSLIWATQDISATEKLVLLALHFYSGRTSKGSSISVSELAKKCSLARPTVSKTIKKLVDRKLLVKKESKDGFPSAYAINANVLFF